MIHGETRLRKRAGFPFSGAYRRFFLMRYNAPMRVISLQSGSNGNCIYVEAGGVKLLFDAGISGVRVRRASCDLRAGRGGRGCGADIARPRGPLPQHGRAESQIRLARLRYRQDISSCRALCAGEISDLRHFCSGETLQFGKVKVETISTPHDSADGVAFVVDDGRRRSAS